MLSNLKEVQIVGEQNTGNNIREQQVMIPSFLLASRTGLTDAKVEVILIDEDEVVVIDTDEVIVIDEEEELVIIEREEASNVSINLFNSFQP